MPLGSSPWALKASNIGVATWHLVCQILAQLSTLLLNVQFDWCRVSGISIGFITCYLTRNMGSIELGHRSS